MKVTVKGGAAVDPESELDDSHHVLEEGGVIWNAVLGLVDVTRGTNSYYKLQLLEGDSAKSYYVFRSWGRVGTTIGGTKSEVICAQCSKLLCVPLTMLRVRVDTYMCLYISKQCIYP